MDPALLGAIAAMLCWGVGDFLIQRSTRKIGDIEALAWIGLIGSAILLPFVLEDLRGLTAMQDLLLLTALGAVTFGAAIFDFEALKQGKISVVDMVISLELPFTIMLGMLFFSERLTLFQASMILALMAGVAMISMREMSFKLTLERGVLFAIVAAVGMALVNFLTAAAAIQVSPLMAIWFPWMLFTAICLVVLWRRHGMTRFWSHAKEHRALIVGMGVFDTLAWLFYAYALKDGDMGIITAITESYVVVAMALGVAINKERMGERQWLGAGIALAASVLLAMTM
jgi:drug/metabolite transporter (DMT)-like permease